MRNEIQDEARKRAKKLLRPTMYADLGQPSTELGKANDLYLDKFNKVFYQKQEGEWIELFSAVGLEGKRGERGERGATGLSGAVGERGEQGPRGEKGERGFMGTRGQRGATGLAGERGLQGENGKDGKDGKDGREIEIRVKNRILQWRYKGDSDWRDLFDLMELSPRSAAAIRPVLQQLPTGGTTGQVLKKKSNTDLDVEWQDDGAVHITGDESVDGVKYWEADQYFQQSNHAVGRTYREGGLSVPGVYLNAFVPQGTTTAIFNDVSARSTYIYQNDDFGAITTPFYVKNEDTGELIKVVGDSGYIWDGCERGLFGTTPSPVTVGDVFTLQPTGDYATYMTPDYERVLVDCTGGLMEVILPNPVDYPTMEDGLTFSICDYVGSLGNGNALIVKDPTNGNSIEVWDPGAIVRATFDLSSGLYTFLSTKSLASDYASPAKYAVRVATTAALSVSSYSFPSLVLSSSLTAIEGVTLKAGDLILVKDQATASQNGVYIYNTSTNLIRDPNFQTGQNFVPGLQFYVAEGIINADSVFILTANDNIVLDTTSLTFRRSGGVQTISSKTANYTVVAADDGTILSYTTLAAARAVTLPALSAVPEGFKITVIDSTTGTHASTNNITIQRAGSDTFVDGTTSKVINIANAGMTVMKINSKWVQFHLPPTFVDLATAQTLSTKTLDNTNTATLKDTLFTLQDDADTTKQAKFQLSGITTATTRTFTLPDADTTLVGSGTNQTITNKRINPRVDSIAGTTSPQTRSIDNFDQMQMTAISVDMTIGAPTGTPVNGQRYVIRLKDNGTARALTWDAIYRAIGVTLPTTTVINKTVYIFMVYNNADTKWDVVDVKQEV